MYCCELHTELKKKTWVFLRSSLGIQARKLKTLLETTFGWDLENSAVNLIDEDDEVKLESK
jgi:hypothetical protein